MTINFLTFASSNWTNSPKRYQEYNEFIHNNYNFFDKFFIWNENDLDKEYQKQFSNYYSDHGFAYFSWKPYCLKQALNSLNDGDYLFYLDSGCVLPIENNNLMSNLFNDIKNCITDIEKNNDKFALTTYIDNNPNVNITNICIVKREILKQFNIEKDVNFLFQYPHYQAGLVLIKKTEENLKFLQKWYDFYTKYYESCIRGGYTDKTNQYSYFIHNGSDQAILQCLLYTKNIKPVNMNFLYRYNLIQHKLG